MVLHLPILSLVTFLPFIGALFIFMIKGDEATVARNSRQLALWASLVTFTLSVVLILSFDSDAAGFQFVETEQWISGLGIHYRMGVDGISVWFVLLSTFLTPLCVLASWESIRSHVKEYMIAFLVLETMMVGMFCALDFVVFYLFFEGVLIPMFLIIGVWGGPRRIYAAFKFFLFTLAGSVLMLIAVLTFYVVVGTTDIQTLMQARIDPSLQYWLWLAFFASFAVKVPMWPVHTWLPDAHVEAPTAGSVILAGVLLKMGAYGFLRFSLPMLPEASLFFQPLIFTLSVVAIIYTSLVALAQEDMKKLVAYSSVAHMGFVTIGIFTVSVQGVEGALFQMLSHGIISAALFLCVGVVYDRIHSRDIARYGGLVHRMPAYALVFMVFTLGALGLPGTSGFIGEFLSLLAAYQTNRLLAVLASIGVVLGAVYMLWLYRRVMLGVLEKEELKSILDLNRREVAIFTPLVVLVLWMGIYPEYFLGFMHVSANNLVENFEIARGLQLAVAAP
tara:strand:+ start:169 stop:1680 length:1512 start_codon:yes stop_codon:yes gene_type:complete